MSSPVLVQKLLRPLFIIPAIFLLALGLGTFWFFQNFEKKEFTEHRNMSPAAFRNPLLAAEKYLQATGQPAVSESGLGIFSNLPQTSDAILIRRMPGGLSEAIIDDLLTWVDAGGHLLLVPSKIDTEHPGYVNFLDRIGVQFHDNDTSDCGCPSKSDDEPEEIEPPFTSPPDKELDETEKTQSQDEDDDHILADDIIINIDIEGHHIQLETFYPSLLEDLDGGATFRINEPFWNEEETQAEENDEDSPLPGAWLLQYTIGEGKITVLSETSLFENKNIGEYDHAFFLSWMVKDANKVWLLYSSNVDSLIKILWHKMPYFWVSFFTTIALILWRMQKQSGLLLPIEGEKRLNVMDHIEASGQFHWRTNKLSPVIKANRKTVLQWWAGRRLGLRPDSDMTDVDISALADKAGISRKIIREAFKQQVNTELDIIQTSRALQRIQTLVQRGESTQDDNEHT